MSIMAAFRAPRVRYSLAITTGAKASRNMANEPGSLVKDLTRGIPNTTEIIGSSLDLGRKASDSMPIIIFRKTSMAAEALARIRAYFKKRSTVEYVARALVSRSRAPQKYIVATAKYDTRWAALRSSSLAILARAANVIHARKAMRQMSGSFKAGAKRLPVRILITEIKVRKSNMITIGIGSHGDRDKASVNGKLIVYRKRMRRLVDEFVCNLVASPDPDDRPAAVGQASWSISRPLEWT